MVKQGLRIHVMQTVQHGAVWAVTGRVGALQRGLKNYGIYEIDFVVRIYVGADSVRKSSSRLRLAVGG